MRQERVTRDILSPLPSVIRFTERELELAHQLAALGLQWNPAPGMFVYDDQERFGGTSPLQNHIYVILDYPLFVKIAGGHDKLRSEWTWLPTWEEGRAWLKDKGKNDAEVLDRIRERVVDMGLTDREGLYELMVLTLRQAKTEMA